MFKKTLNHNRHLAFTLQGQQKEESDRKEAENLLEDKIVENLPKNWERRQLSKFRKERDF